MISTEHSTASIMTHSQGLANYWVASFLEGRKQYVSLMFSNGSVLSQVKYDCVDIIIGVPQGSILDPMLFLLYASEFGNIILDASFIIHNDTSLLVSDSSDEYLSAKTNSLLGSVNARYEFDYLYLN